MRLRLDSLQTAATREAGLSSSPSHHTLHKSLLGARCYRSGMRFCRALCSCPAGRFCQSKPVQFVSFQGDFWSPFHTAVSPAQDAGGYPLCSLHPFLQDGKQEKLYNVFFFSFFSWTTSLLPYQWQKEHLPSYFYLRLY